MPQGRRIDRRKFLQLGCGMVAAVALGATSTSRRANTYYLDATNGDDGADGLSAASAWKTLSRLNGASYGAGDRIRFKRGETWRESLHVNASGNSGQPIVFEAYGIGARPRISGCDRVTDWNLYRGTTYRAAFTAGIDIHLLLEDGDVAYRVESLEAITGPRQFFYDSQANIVYYRASDDSDPNAHAMEIGARWDAININNRRHIEFRGIHAHGAGGQYGRGFGAEGQWQEPQDIVLRGCEASHCWYAGVWAHSAPRLTAIDKFEIHDTRIHDNALFGVITEGDWSSNLITGVVIRGCHIHDNGLDDFTGEHAVWLRWTEEAVFQSNEVVNNRGKYAWGGGLYLDTAKNTLISGNHFAGNSRHNINIDVASNGFRLANNLIRHAADGGLVIEEHQRADGTSAVYNNTFVDNMLNVRLGPGMRVHEVGGVTFMNNILTTSRSHNVYAPTGHLNNTYDYNLYQYTGPNRSFVYDDVWLDFSDWKQNSGQDPHSIQARPDFTDQSANDYTLERTSPAINAGTTAVGLPYRGEAPDIGYAENE